MSTVGTTDTKPFKKRMSSPAWISLLVIALGIGALFGVQHIIMQRQQSATLPQAIVSKVQTFTPYYFPGEIPHGFVLKPATATFENDVLIFQIINTTNKQVITVSQQALPAALADETYPNAEKIQGADGYAVIVYTKTQTTGSLFSAAHKGKKTMVLLNTHNPVEQATLADLLRSLRPLR